MSSFQKLKLSKVSNWKRNGPQDVRSLSFPFLPSALSLPRSPFFLRPTELLPSFLFVMVEQYARSVQKWNIKAPSDGSENTLVRSVASLPLSLLSLPPKLTPKPHLVSTLSRSSTSATPNSSDPSPPLSKPTTSSRSMNTQPNPPSSRRSRNSFTSRPPLATSPSTRRPLPLRRTRTPSSRLEGCEPSLLLLREKSPSQLLMCRTISSGRLRLRLGRQR